MVDYRQLQTFDVIAVPLIKPGQELRVTMNAVLADMDDSPLFHAASGLWEEGYLYHLQHTGGVEPELAAKLTQHLEANEVVNFQVTCFVEELMGIGFVGVPRVG